LGGGRSRRVRAAPARSNGEDSRAWLGVARAAVAKPAERVVMINESVRCPSCGQFGYIVATGTADLEEFVATICHYCGHILDRDGLRECLAQHDAERNRNRRR
jgi:hypothetical protein